MMWTIYFPQYSKMAAPISSESELSESNEIPDYLDPMSPHFDPQRALYANYIPYNMPGSKQFNNLTEFENVLQGKDAKAMQKNKAKQNVQKAHKLNLKSDTSAKASEAERKAAILAKCGGPSERSEAQLRRRRPPRNVFTRMEGYNYGPMSLLRQCVQERLRVIVVVRAAVAVRSRCRGYLIAFDKHFNLALMDVDEKFIRPVSKNKKSTKWSAASSSKSGRSVYISELSQGSQDSCGLSAVTGQLAIGSDTSRPSATSRFSDKIQTSSGKPQTSGDCVRTKQEKVSFSDSESSNFKRPGYKSDSNVQAHRHFGSVKLDKRSVHSDSETSKGAPHKEKVKQKLKQKYTPFWPLYKKWTEERCYAEYEIVDRHVNQLFVRGDNVVSVSIADC